MDLYGRPMRVHPGQTRRRLALAGFTDINETVIRVCYSPWSEDGNAKEAGRWFNVGLSEGLMALSLSAMVTILGMSEKEVEVLCEKVRQEICTLSYHAYCRM